MNKLSLAEQSSIISCEHMKQLAIKERDNNYYQFHKNITNCNIIEHEKTNSINEFKIQIGLQTNKNNCIIKTPDYNNGEWEKQFQKILPESFGNVFNIKSKKI